MIEDYSNFSYTLGKRPTSKLWLKLLRKLTTYVDSNKFLRLGSTVDLYDEVTGKRVKRPIYGVLYKKSFLDEQGIPALQLRHLLKLALRNKDRKTIKLLLLYDTYSANRFVTPRELQLILDKKRRSRVLLLAVVLGGAGSLLGLIPFMVAKREGRQGDPDVIKQSLVAAGVGIGAGITATGILESFRG